MIDDDDSEHTYPCAPLRSNCFRARYSLRSRSWYVPGAVSVNSTWRMTGSVERAISPRISGRVGTSRHPRIENPCAATACSSSCTATDAALVSAARKTIPTANGCAGSSEIPVEASSNSRGIAVWMPMPSLDFPSAATAPRCARRASAVSAFVRMSWEGWFSRVATNPTPHDSKSNRESIRLSPQRARSPGTRHLGREPPVDRAGSAQFLVPISNYNGLPFRPQTNS